MKLQQAVDQIANDYIKTEIEYLGEVEFTLAEALVHLEDEFWRFKQHRNNLHAIFVAVGRKVVLPQAEYDAMVLQDKRRIYPIINGSRWQYLQTDEEFIEAHAPKKEGGAHEDSDH